MSDQPTRPVVPGAQAQEGDRGEQWLARTPKVALRLWEGEDAGVVSPEHRNDYDYVAYLLAGVMEVTIGDAEAVEVRAGDSYAVPADTPYSFRVTQAAKVIEAVAT